jgi:hypothetical protein
MSPARYSPAPQVQAAREQTIDFFGTQVMVEAAVRQPREPGEGYQRKDNFTFGPYQCYVYWAGGGQNFDRGNQSDELTRQDRDASWGASFKLDDGNEMWPTGQIDTDTDGTTYQLNYGGVSTQDTPVSQWDAYTRPLRFDSIKTTSTTPGATHPLATALDEWTTLVLPGADVWWQVTDSPRVREEVEHYNIWLDKMRATAVGHIVTADPQTIVPCLDRLAAILPRASIRYADTFLSTIEVTRADPEADPHQDGQISIDVAYGQANGNFWAGIPGQDALHPWITLPGPDDPQYSIPLEHVEVRDGVLVGVVPVTDQPRENLRGVAHGTATSSGQFTTQP